MKSLRVFVILILLGLAAPFAIRHRAWSLGIPATQPIAQATAPDRQATRVAPPDQTPQPVSAASETEPAPSQPLPGSSSSLPLLSVIGFGVFLGGVISALKTRPAHK